MSDLDSLSNPPSVGKDCPDSVIRLTFFFQNLFGLAAVLFGPFVPIQIVDEADDAPFVGILAHFDSEVTQYRFHVQESVGLGAYASRHPASVRNG